MPECRFSDFSFFDLANLPNLQLQLFQLLTYRKSCHRQEINLPALAVAIISTTYKNDTLYTDRIRQVFTAYIVLSNDINMLTMYLHCKASLPTLYRTRYIVPLPLHCTPGETVLPSRSAPLPLHCVPGEYTTLLRSPCIAFLANTRRALRPVDLSRSCLATL